LEKLHSMNILWFLDLLPEVLQGKFLTSPNYILIYNTSVFIEHAIKELRDWPKSLGQMAC